MGMIIWIIVSATTPIIFGRKLASQLEGLLMKCIGVRIFLQSDAVMDRQYYYISCDYPVDNMIVPHYNYPDTILTNFWNYSNHYWITA